MIDFHCHFLPAVDDGAKNVTESVGILDELRRQQVSCVVATPHFNASEEDVLSFAGRRGEAYEKIRELVPEGLDVLLGAEVYVTPELAKINDIEKLCIGSSRCILFEMPYSPWQKWMFDVIFEAKEMGITPVLAHAERYFEGKNLFKYKRFFETENIYMQFNAESFLSMSGRRIIKAFLKNDVKMLLGSDAHNLKSRKPEMEKAKKIIVSRFGDDIFTEIENSAEMLLIK